MAARRVKAVRAQERVAVVSVDDPQVDRAIAAVRGAVEQLQAQRSRVVLEVDLEIGTNKVRHGLGRAVAGYTLTPTTASAAFAHAIDKDNPRPELEVWVTVIGAAQPGASLEVW